MVCKSCRENVFRQKLGRCRRCMWINIMLLIGSGVGWAIGFQIAPKHVTSIALLLAFVASGILMLVHLIAYLYYRSKGIKHPTEDKLHLK